MTTQGNANKNQNNHPFSGKAEEQKFALAHNGVLTNDWELRKLKKLPLTSVETDSYIAVQLIEQQEEVSFKSLKAMAEEVEGNFTFTVLAQDNSIYFVKGSNPLTIYHYPKLGLYLYASTVAILETALAALGMEKMKHKTIQPDSGDILRIDSKGQQERSTFSFTDYWSKPAWLELDRTPPKPKNAFSHTTQGEYIQAMKTVAEFHGFEAEYIDFLISDGYSLSDIEEMIYCRRY